MAYQVFISHGWADRWVAEQIEKRVREDCGAATFIDVFDLHKGDDIEERVVAEMRKSQELVVLLTPWSVDRNWVWVEIGAARLAGCRIVAVLYQLTLDIIDQNKGGTTFLRSKNVVDINEMDTYLKELKARTAGA